MTQIRLGYVCVNLSVGRRGLTSRTCRLRDATRARLEALARVNLKSLSEVLQTETVRRDTWNDGLDSGALPSTYGPQTIVIS